MQFETGAHPTMPSDITAFGFIAHKGDFSINAEKGTDKNKWKADSS